MDSTDIIEAPNLQPRGNATDSQWRQEHNAFVRLLPELLKTHPGKFVAVHNGAVVAVGDSFKAAALDAYKRIGYVPIHVGLVSEAPPPPARLPSPRIARPAASA
jgi:hypothetical protein